MASTSVMRGTSMDSTLELPQPNFLGPTSRSESRTPSRSGSLKPPSRSVSRSGSLKPPSRSESRFASLDPTPSTDSGSVSLDRLADQAGLDPADDHSDDQAASSSDETTVLGDLDNMVDNVVDSVMDIAFEAHSSVFDFLSDITGQITSRKTHTLNIIPEDVQVELAFAELAEMKRESTMGHAWNSATMFSIIVFIYTVVDLIYLISSEEATACKYWQVYFGLRSIVLVPSCLLAWLWAHDRWPRYMPLPEIMGFLLFSYFAFTITVGFTTFINQSCGQQNVLPNSSIYAQLISKETGERFQSRRANCAVFDDGGSEVSDCEAKFVDRRSWFELHVAEFAGHLVLALFLFSALFTPEFSTSVAYTVLVFTLGFLGCWWQGAEFWTDSDRVAGSGVSGAIFLFLFAAAANIYNSLEMAKLENSLLNASHQLNANKQSRPVGKKVVYLKAEIVGLQELMAENEAMANRALALCKGLFTVLSKTYFGFEFEQSKADAELKKLLSEGSPLTPEQCQSAQELMKLSKKEENNSIGDDSQFLLCFHDVYDAITFALTFQDDLMDLDWDRGLRKSPTRAAATEGVDVSREEKRLYARAVAMGKFRKGKLTAFHGLRVKIGVHLGTDEDGLKGTTVAFTKALSSLAEGGMVLVSPPVANILAGALDQLTSRTKNQDNVPKLVHMGSLIFKGSAVYHEALRMRFAEIAEMFTHTPKKTLVLKAANAFRRKLLMKRSHKRTSIEGANAKLEQAMMASTEDPATLPVDVWHIYHEPLFGRHLLWDDANLKLNGAKQLASGYYDAPVNREDHPEFAAVCFGDIESSHDLIHQDHPAFTLAVQEVVRVMTLLLVKYNGYNVPQREGHYMHTFNDPNDAIAYHTELQQALLHSPHWPSSYANNPLTAPYRDPNEEGEEDGELLYNGLLVSMGLSVGKISKALERTRANYLGPTCNRAARVCGVAKGGQLLMCQGEYEHEDLKLLRAQYKAHVLLTNQTLKGIKGLQTIVSLETDPLTSRRAAVPRPKPKGKVQRRQGIHLKAGIPAGMKARLLRQASGARVTEDRDQQVPTQAKELSVRSSRDNIREFQDELCL